MIMRAQTSRGIATARSCFSTKSIMALIPGELLDSLLKKCMFTIQSATLIYDWEGSATASRSCTRQHTDRCRHESVRIMSLLSVLSGVLAGIKTSVRVTK